LAGKSPRGDDSAGSRYLRLLRVREVDQRTVPQEKFHRGQRHRHDVEQVVLLQKVENKLELGGLKHPLVPSHASASIPSRTPASVANGRSGHADTIASCHARSARRGDSGDHAVRLVNRRNWHCLC